MAQLDAVQHAVLNYLAGNGGQFEPQDYPRFGSVCNQLREMGLILTLGDSHYLTNAGKSVLRYYAEGASPPEEMLR